MSSPRMKRLSIIGSTMILVIVPFCLYYLFYVQSQNQYFTKRNFRVLAGIGDQMKSKIDNLGTSLINAVKNAQQEKKAAMQAAEQVARLRYYARYLDEVEGRGAD